MPPKLFLAVKAFVVFENKILIIRESPAYETGVQPGKFDVPGGRIKPGESWKKTLLREVNEETGLTVTIGKPFFVNEVRNQVKDEEWQIVRVFFECQTNSNQVQVSTDHDRFEWINPSEYKNYLLIPNLVEVFQAFLEDKAC